MRHKHDMASSKKNRYFPRRWDKALAKQTAPIVRPAKGRNIGRRATRFRRDSVNTTLLESTKFSGATKHLRKTTVVNIHKKPYDVLCTRPGKWGNPFKIGRDGTREEVVTKHRKQFLANRRRVEECIRELSGKKLGCVCKLKLCHCDVYAEVCNSDAAYWYKLRHL
jgi:hypothetical protein